MAVKLSLYCLWLHVKCFRGFHSDGWFTWVVWAWLLACMYDCVYECSLINLCMCMRGFVSISFVSIIIRYSFSKVRELFFISTCRNFITIQNSLFVSVDTIRRINYSMVRENIVMMSYFVPTLAKKNCVPMWYNVDINGHSCQLLIFVY